MKKFVNFKTKKSKHKIRVNITVDKDTLVKAKTKLSLFGGKLSTLFNAYLNDFVVSMEERKDKKSMEEKIKELEERLNRIEKREKRKV